MRPRPPPTDAARSPPPPPPRSANVTVPVSSLPPEVPLVPAPARPPRARRARADHADPGGVTGRGGAGDYHHGGCNCSYTQAIELLPKIEVLCRCRSALFYKQTCPSRGQVISITGAGSTMQQGLQGTLTSVYFIKVGSDDDDDYDQTILDNDDKIDNYDIEAC